MPPSYDSEDDQQTVKEIRPQMRTAAGTDRPRASSAKFSNGGADNDCATVVRRKEPEINTAAWLYCRKGLRKGHVYQIKQERSEFGRGSDTDIVIEDQYSGSRHGAILFEADSWQIFDFASKNGTRLNGEKLGSRAPNPSPLNDGDTIEIGDTEMIFKCIVI